MHGASQPSPCPIAPPDPRMRGPSCLPCPGWRLKGGEERYQWYQKESWYWCYPFG